MTLDSAVGPLVPLAPAGAAAPLFCVHPVSGSAYAYAGLSSLLGDDRPVYGLEAPGFDDDQDPVGSLPALSAGYVEALRQFRPDGPYCLLGWSLGGVVAFDMALRLRAVGARVPALVLVDSDLPVRTPLPTGKTMVQMFMHDLLRVADLPVAGLDGVFAGFPADADPDAVLAAVAEAGVLPVEADADFLGDRYAVFRVYLAALYDYERPGDFLGRLTFVRAAESNRDTMCWDTAAATVQEHVVPGDHHSMWVGANLEMLADIVRRALATADPG
ncbi:MAG: hypothetical protein V7637_1013 [Mycobacteriales bacterium]